MGYGPPFEMALVAAWLIGAMVVGVALAVVAAAVRPD